MTRGIAGVLAAALAAAGASAEEPAQRTELVVAGAEFGAGGFHRLLFGDNYRELWTTPVELPVLDMKNFAGGLKAVRRLGHGQTKALALAGADGGAYTFRPILKDPVGLLPIELRETVAARVVRDQMSSQHPAGHVVVPGLMEAVGILHNTPRLVVMPDDPALGEFRDDFKGLAGDIEEFTGQEGFGGALEIIEGEEMWKRLDASPETRVDSRAYLKVRLVDHLIGDWDRHREQWRWARMPGQASWQPIPEDRDQAFVRFQGALAMFLRPALPLLVDFKGEYSSLDGLTFDSWDVDRRLLNDLGPEAFDEVAREVQSKLSDSVIEASVRRMPKEWFDVVGPETIAALKRRRDALPEHARRFYRFFARQVDVRCSEQDDAVEIERFAGGEVELRVALLAAPETPYYRRRFSPRETGEVRVYLLSGNDRVTTRGPRGGVAVRVIGGPGEETIDDSAVGGLRVSDADAVTQLHKGPGTTLDAKPYAPPPPSPRGAWIPPRDWGRRTLFPVIRLTGSSDYGVVVNLGLKTTGYGFRKDPFADEQTLRASFATRVREFRGEYEGRFRFENSKLEAGLRARASGFEIVRFYGFGNESAAPLPDNDYRVHQDQFSLAPSLRFELGSRGSLSVGGELKHVITERAPDSPIDRLRPYGSDDITQLGATAGFGFDSTDRSGLPTRGVRLSGGGAFYPAALELDHSFGEVHGEAAAYFGSGPTLALRAGGKRVFGTYPFYEAAFLGGSPSLRGLRLQRYAGDAMLHGSGELYVPLSKAFLFVPGEIGFFGLADVGRVYLDGEDSTRWHRGFGGGLYFVSPNRNNSVALSVARSEGRSGVYLKVGLAVQ